MNIEIGKDGMYEVQKTVQKLVGDDARIEVRISNKAKKKAKLPPALFVFQEFALYAAKNLTPSAIQILMYFIGISEFENYVSMDILTLSEELNLHERQIIRAIQELTELEIIVKAKNVTDRRRNDYFLHPDAVFKGDSNKRIEMRLKMQEAGIISTPENPKQIMLWNNK